MSLESGCREGKDRQETKQGTAGDIPHGSAWSVKPHPLRVLCFLEAKGQSDEFQNSDSKREVPAIGE